ncbi:MAG: mechanosensitive ion channel domain-containing protein [Methylophilaceae bacterium]|jgi:small-conductance mechanosensitive channel
MNFQLSSFDAYLNFYTLIEFLILLASVLLSYYFVADNLKRFVSNKAKSKILKDGLARILFPLCSIILIGIAQTITSLFFTQGILLLGQKLLIALLIIRVSVYLVRYLTNQNSIIRSLENVISIIIWILFLLQISGILPQIIDALDNITFKIGAQKLSLLVMIQAVFAIFIAILVAMTISKFIENKLLKTSQLDPNARVMLGKVFRIFLYFVAVVVSLSSIGINLTFLSVLGGAFGVGLAFGLQKIASNYVCGFIILMDKSIHIGDILLVGEHYGVVTLIRSRYTVLRKLDGIEVIIPNETLISENIINHSFSDRKARISIEVQISYKSSVDKAFEIMLNAAKSEKRVLKDPEPATYLRGFGDSGIDLLLSFYIVDPEEGSWGLKSDINRKIWKKFQEEGIEIPYPYRTVEIVNKEKL